MRILLAHFRVGETDGVSLEMDKWKYVLEGLGHKCFYLAGNGGVADFVIDEMYYLDSANRSIVDNAYKGVETMTESELKSKIFDIASKIENKLIDIIKKNNIDVVIPNNIWSLGWHLPCGIAFTNAAKKYENVMFIGHNHDFYWERELYSNPKYEFVSDILKDYFTPNLKNTTHFVINTIAKNELKKRTDIDATVAPNVFDFNAPTWEADDFNSDLRKKSNIDENDIVLLQATRIGERKAIEFAIRVAEYMNEYKSEYYGKKLYNGKTFSKNNKIIFVLAGLDESLGGGYFDKLKVLLNDCNVEYRYINDIVKHARSYGEQKIYSLFDTYTMCDAVTYPSILEGWGNQLLEAMFAKKPVLYYEYPVFISDLKAVGIQGVSLQSGYNDTKPLLSLNEDRYDSCAKEMLNILFNKERYSRIVENNFKIGCNNFSYSTLRQILLEKISIYVK